MKLLSRNKVSVGEPADGSPPKKSEAGAPRAPVSTFFCQGVSLLFTLNGVLQLQQHLLNHHASISQWGCLFAVE